MAYKFNPLPKVFDRVGNGGGGGDITITGNNNLPQTSDTFVIDGINGFLFNWDTGSSQFQIIPPNTFTHSVNSITTTSAALLPGNSNILTNPSITTVSLPSNSSTILGDLVEVVGLSGGYIISQAANQQVYIGADSTTLGATGTTTATGSIRNSVTLRCISTAGGVFLWSSVVGPQGTFVTA